ncbi:glutaredoxin family protein [Thermomonas sp.]|uniref:glutaredoxin family protein n=1 Tax=Thermomonas sp. TaxID=1971895 RepID=UPI002486D2A0|nr:glutaredoxin family protein [Thermomonas sp.]MDI1252104.1 glutaredoxin family protein [Thermomonas sp.]
MNKFTSFVATSALLAGSLWAGIALGPRLPGLVGEVFPWTLYDNFQYKNSMGLQADQLYIFTTSTCPYCKRLRGFLKENHIAYTEFTTDKSKSALTLYEKIGGEGVPVSIIRGKKFVGFNSRIGELIKKSTQG